MRDSTTFVTLLACMHAFVLLTSCVTASEPKPILRAGVAAVDITPKEFPLNMPGGFRANMAERAHDPLHARALVFDDGSMTLAMVVVDCLGASKELLDEAKATASRKTGIPANRMLICSTHTHSGPPSNVKKGSEAAVAYRQMFLEGTVKSIIRAHSRLQLAAVGAASHPMPDEVFNRRWFLKPGKMPLNPFGEFDRVKMNPGYSSDVLDRPAGPTDPDITIISVQDARRKPLALFANYSLHYVGGVPRGQVSADYFGEFSRLMPSRLRGDQNFVAMMSNGTSGDINNLPFLVTRPRREPFEQIRIVARKAADTAWFAHRKIEQHRSNVQLGMRERNIILKHRTVSDKELAEARRIVSLKDEKTIRNCRDWLGLTLGVPFH